jgi:hypothetical protein
MILGYKTLLEDLHSLAGGVFGFFLCMIIIKPLLKGGGI